MADLINEETWYGVKNDTFITHERLKEIAALTVTYDDDIPEFSDSDLKGFAPAHPEYFKVTPIKKAISIKIDLDVLEALKAQGKGYQTRINSILREAVLSHQ